MRDPARIDLIIERLRAYWHAHPDMRLGQIVMNALRNDYGEVDTLYAFNAEEPRFLRGMSRLEDAAKSGKKASGR